MHLGRELERDACGNQRRFWGSVNGNRERDRISWISSRDGRILMEEEEVREHWKEHFEGLYREADNSSQPTQEDGSEVAEEEVKRGVMRLKVRKAAGICGIMPEILKAGGEVVVE